jgi:signal transduction histidine kinase
MAVADVADRDRFASRLCAGGAMRYHPAMGRGFQLSSGRVIALGRLLLASLFLLAIWLELGRHDEAPFAALLLSVGYWFFAAALLVATWNDWWADAKLAGAAHTLDIAVFTLLVLLTQGYTSPFFSFFVFVLISAAIRWGWRATALTALLVTLLYVTTGLLVGNASNRFDVQHFVVRTGHLLIFSLILIWFGITQWKSRLPAPLKAFDETSADGTALEASLVASAAILGAARGAFLWKDRDGLAAGRLIDSAVTPVDAPDFTIEATPFLYDMPKDHALRRDSEGSLQSFAPSESIGPEAAQALSLSTGLGIPVRSTGGEGMIFAEGMSDLSTDHIDLGEQIATGAAAQLQRHALLRNAEERAAGQSRVSLARDLHDSVVQFLAGAAFRMEAMKRGAAAGADLTPEIEELKQLMLHEQGELRAFIAALRSGSRIAVSDVANDLRTLTERLAKQWDVNCSFSAETGSAMVPAKLHQDAQQLVREAVANAVRHAGAKTISVRLDADAGFVRIELLNDGAAYPKTKDGGRMPQSLRERVEEAGGTIDLSRGMGVTKLSIALPIARSGA